MKAKKTRTIKMTLQITVLCLFSAAFLLPKGGQSYLMTGIAAAGVIVSLAILIIPACFRTPEIADSGWEGNGYRKRELGSGNHPDPEQSTTSGAFYRYCRKNWGLRSPVSALQ